MRVAWPDDVNAILHLGQILDLPPETLLIH